MNIEVVRPGFVPGSYRAVMFDFDGTLSLIRGGWTDVMASMMIEEFRRHGDPRSSEDLVPLVREAILRLNGRPAIHQMEWLVGQVSEIGGSPHDSAEYLNEYDRRLGEVIARRRQRIESGAEPSNRYLVPGSTAILGRLRRRGLSLYLCSGTMREFVEAECEILGIRGYFGSQVFAPESSQPGFTKRQVIDRIISEHGGDPAALLSFGDGVVETEEVRKVGGTAVAVASNENGGSVRDESKRDRLTAAGADLVVPHYGDGTMLEDLLFPRN